MVVLNIWITKFRLLLHLLLHFENPYPWFTKIYFVCSSLKNRKFFSGIWGSVSMGCCCCCVTQPLDLQDQVSNEMIAYDIFCLHCDINIYSWRLTLFDLKNNTWDHRWCQLLSQAQGVIQGIKWSSNRIKAMIVELFL